MTKQLVKPCEFVGGACINCAATEQSDCEGWVCSPKRPWVGLTEDEKFEMAAAQYGWEDLLIAAEARLKEKNNV